MQGVDTNVLVRFVTRDEPEQFALSEALVGGAATGELYVDPIVLVELNWTLRRVYRLGRSEVLDVLNGLLDSREFTVGQRSLVLAAISSAYATGCDFSDALIALLHEAAGCANTLTFDTRALRLAQMRPVQEHVR